MFEFRRIRDAITVLRGDAIAAHKPGTWPRLPRGTVKRRRQARRHDEHPRKTYSPTWVMLTMSPGDEKEGGVRASGTRIVGKLYGFEPASGRPIVKVSG